VELGASLSKLAGETTVLGLDILMQRDDLWCRGGEGEGGRERERARARISTHLSIMEAGGVETCAELFSSVSILAAALP